MAHLRRTLIATLVQWIPLAALTVLLTGMIYLATQQSYRSGANDPQIQMASDAVNALERGASPEDLVTVNKIDISQSLAPYLAIYDANHQIVASSATLHGGPLALPSGVFDNAQSNGMNVLTWQPEADVRSAIVVKSYPGGFVLAGRSLQSVEERETSLERLLFIGGLATLALTFAAIFVTRLALVRPAQQG
ncbi:MAG TPA: hypothetical protein VHR15_20665 [Ktedonobacterales bacterium]|nr:hypothetical protein [Ktedonobacterales bacterium]